MIHSDPEAPFVGVQNLCLDIDGALLWRLELATGGGGTIPVPLDHEEPPRDLVSPPDPAHEEYWVRTVEILLEIGEAEPRELKCWLGPREVAGSRECREVLEYRFARGPVDRIELDARDGVLFEEVVSLLTTIRQAKIPQVPFVILGPIE